MAGISINIQPIPLKPVETKMKTIARKKKIIACSLNGTFKHYVHTIGNLPTLLMSKPTSTWPKPKAISNTIPFSSVDSSSLSLQTCTMKMNIIYSLGFQVEENDNCKEQLTSSLNSLSYPNALVLAIFILIASHIIILWSKKLSKFADILFKISAKNMKKPVLVE